MLSVMLHYTYSENTYLQLFDDVCVCDSYTKL